MPTYDYKCKECGYIFEAFQKLSEKPLEFCPKCSGSVKRLISATGIIFKGSGFYVTDYKKKKTVRPASSDRLAKRAGGQRSSSKPKAPESSSKAASPKKSK